MSIDEVAYYKVAGQYCFQGDLIFTNGCIYFFPHTDLNQRIPDFSNELETPIGGLLDEFFMRPVVLPLINTLAMRSANRSRLRTMGLWREVDSDEVLKSKLDGFIAELRRNRTPTDTLPIPSRFEHGEVSNLKLSAAGVLSFEAQSDTHDFCVGIFKKRLLREVLWQCGFITGRQSA
ncbi:MAG TPA: hypothetical protein VGV59_02470 [Pyrinomonadaceae bacterium]|nr:hypothetical protein [Pyrinomonadaceae bacterium]